MSLENSFAGKIFSGDANLPLARKIAQELSVPLGTLRRGHFNDGEQWIKYDESLRGADVFLIQPTCPPVDRNYMQLFQMLRAATSASARRITLVMPYYGYQRQDRKDQPRVAATAGLMADLLEAAFGNGVSARVLFMDLHAPQLENAYHRWCQVDHLYARPIFFQRYVSDLGLDTEDLVVASPDAGGVKLAAAYAVRLSQNSPAFIYKERSRQKETAGESQALEVIGNVAGKDVLLVDDLIDTAGTLVNAAKRLMENGARRVFACATHGLFSKDALEKIALSPIAEVCVTDTVAISRKKIARAKGKVRVVSVAPLIAEAIRRTHRDESISSLFA